MSVQVDPMAASVVAAALSGTYPTLLPQWCLPPREAPLVGVRTHQDSATAADQPLDLSAKPRNSQVSLNPPFLPRPNVSASSVFESPSCHISVSFTVLIRIASVRTPERFAGAARRKLEGNERDTVVRSLVDSSYVSGVMSHAANRFAFAE